MPQEAIALEYRQKMVKSGKVEVHFYEILNVACEQSDLPEGCLSSVTAKNP